MNVNTVTYLNITIHSIKKKDLLDNINGVIFTPNVDHLIKLQEDRLFYELYQKADWRVCDSKILYFLSKSFKTPIVETITGVDLFADFCKNIQNNPKKYPHRLFILGGTTSDMLKKAVYNLECNAKTPFVVGAYSPPFGFENNIDQVNQIIKEIHDSGADTLAVALGAPKQEKLIFLLKDQLPNVKIYFAIGATIDFLSGELRRAPVWIRKIGFEWFYRLINDPKRLFRRYLMEDIFIFWLLFKQIIGIYKNPFDSN